jgi:UDP-N-acetyl-D-mannosaminuronate dehydrogenase
VGLGYVGLPLAVAFAEAGCDVIGKVATMLEDAESDILASASPACSASNRTMSGRSAAAISQPS